MKALVLEGVKKASVKTVPDPQMEADSILIDVRANGVC